MGTSPGSGRLFITYLCRQGLPGRLARGKYSSCHSRVHAPSSSLGTKRKGAWLHALWLRLAPILGCDWSTHLKEKKKKGANWWTFCILGPEKLRVACTAAMNYINLPTVLPVSPSKTRGQIQVRGPVRSVGVGVVACGWPGCMRAGTP